MQWFAWTDVRSPCRMHPIKPPRNEWREPLAREWEKQEPHLIGLAQVLQPRCVRTPDWRVIVVRDQGRVGQVLVDPNENCCFRIGICGRRECQNRAIHEKKDCGASGKSHFLFPPRSNEVYGISSSSKYPSFKCFLVHRLITGKICLGFLPVLGQNYEGGSMRVEDSSTLR